MKWNSGQELSIWFLRFDIPWAAFHSHRFECQNEPYWFLNTSLACAFWSIVNSFREGEKERKKEQNRKLRNPKGLKYQSSPFRCYLLQEPRGDWHALLVFHSLSQQKNIAQPSRNVDHLHPHLCLNWKSFSVNNVQEGTERTEQQPKRFWQRGFH